MGRHDAMGMNIASRSTPSRPITYGWNNYDDDIVCMHVMCHCSMIDIDIVYCRRYTLLKLCFAIDQKPSMWGGDVRKLCDFIENTYIP